MNHAYDRFILRLNGKPKLTTNRQSMLCHRGRRAVYRIDDILVVDWAAQVPEPFTFAIKAGARCGASFPISGPSTASICACGSSAQCC